MDITRRKFIVGAACAAAGIAVASKPIVAAASYYDYTPLSFVNLHTNERMTVRYRDSQGYIASAMNEINHFFRDFRTGEVVKIDPKLIDQIYSLNNYLDRNNTIELISGYRSPATNGMLASHSKGVAQKSFHMLGQAADINMPKQVLSDIYGLAKSFKSGGTGIYSGSKFVHIDTGPVRTWVG